MKTVLKHILIFISCVSTFTILWLSLARHLDPSDYPLSALALMVYPLALVMHLLLSIIWSFKKCIWKWMCWTGILLNFPMLSDTAQIDLISSDGDYSLVSYNAQLFGFYQFDRNEEVRDKGIELLAELDGDILCFQEFYYRPGTKGFRTIGPLFEKIGTLELHEKYTHVFKFDQQFGVVTMSKFPIIHRGYIPFKADINNFCIYTDILLPSSDTVRVFNAHLASIHFRPEDYAFVNGGYRELSTFGKGLSQILDKLSAANSRRAMQVKTVMKELERSPYPTLFAGDFNDTPFSFTYTEIKNALSDGFCSAGSGLGSTYQGPFPSYRIDHVFHSNDLNMSRYEVIEEGKSDHYPIRCEFSIARE